MMRNVKVLGLMLAILAAPALVYAQATIAGVVRDTSGAILPGVTVEASSPALIERVRSVVTDGSGQYRVVDLRPGSYTVTFTLPGFRTVRREGIELSGAFTASVNAEMAVGAVEETVTVTGEAPIVDVRSSSAGATIDDEVLAAIPTGRQFFNLTQLVPGVDQGNTDVGGSSGPNFVAFRSRGGSRDEGQLQVNGFPAGYAGLGISYYVADLGAAQEVQFGLSGGSGASRTGGPTMNVVPREGGNTFRGSLFANGASGALEGSNFTAEHEAAGLQTPNQLDKIWDVNTYFGGPIQRDRLWFFTSYRHQGNQKTLAGLWANKNAGDPTQWFYEPDLGRQATETGSWINATSRITWQASSRDKFSVYWDEQKICRLCLGGEGAPGFFGGYTAPEATSTNEGWPQRHAHALWTSPVTSRLLIEAGFSFNNVQFGGVPKEPVDTTNLIRVEEQGGLIPSLTYRSTNWSRPFGATWTWRGSASYVTGAHKAKFGYEGNHYYTRGVNHTNSHLLAYRFNNRVPNRLTMTLASPLVTENLMQDYSLYAQDEWTYGRLTLRGGVRYEYQSGSFPEQTIGTSRFNLQPIVVAAQDSPVKMHDIAPRIGAAYDLFGNGRTALRGSFGRYVAHPSGPFKYGGAFNPASRLVTSVNRNWSDNGLNGGIAGDFTPQCDLLNPAANGECGAWDNRNFGSSVIREVNDPATVEGWNVRFDSWDLALGVQHQFTQRVGVDVEYSRRQFGNFLVTDNRAVGPADFTSFCVTAPDDSRLPSGTRGAQICGLRDVNPDKFGQVDNYITFADNFGGISRVYNGVNATLNVRAAGGVTLQGGFSTGSTVYDECALREQLPEVNPLSGFCRVQNPYQTNLSGLATYTIPVIAVQVSGTFSTKAVTAGRGFDVDGNVVDGESLSGNVVVPSVVIAQSLGRPLSGGAPIAFIDVVEPGKLYGDRITNVDFRVSKLMRFGGRRLMVGLDVYNVFNSDAVLSYIQTLGPRYLAPTQLLQARFAKFTAQFDF